MDPRGVITTYGYDSLNRLHTVDYNVGTTGVAATPSLVYTYGTNSAQNNNGRLITLTDGVGSENYSYDPNLPLTTQVQKVVSGTTYTTGYQYNLAGELKQITYPSGRVVQQNYDTIGRLCAIAQTSSGCSSNTNPFATGYTYNTAFELTGFNYANGVAATFGYSADRLQMTSLSYVKGTTTLYSLDYAFGTTGHNNDQISSLTDNVDNGRSVTFGYDNLARLANAVTLGSTAYPKWGLSFNYDAYGNRTQQSISTGCVAPMNCPTNSVAVSTGTNRITTSGYAYDANGNMTNDGVNALTYDGENRLLTSSGSLGSGAYLYDGNGVRLKKCVPNCTSPTTTTIYAFSGSKVIAEYVNGAAPASPTREYIYSVGALLAKIEAGATQYYHADHLSARVMTDSSGNKIGEQGHFPYGETWYATNTTTKWEFTSYERDSESGNDYAMARYHVNRLGRFSSLDLLAGSIGDPQSLSKFAYVLNDPVNHVDPSGMDCQEPTQDETCTSENGEGAGAAPPTSDPPLGCNDVGCGSNKSVDSFFQASSTGNTSDGGNPNIGQFIPPIDWGSQSVFGRPMPWDIHGPKWNPDTEVLTQPSDLTKLFDNNGEVRSDIQLMQLDLCKGTTCAPRDKCQALPEKLLPHVKNCNGDLLPKPNSAGVGGQAAGANSEVPSKTCALTGFGSGLMNISGPNVGSFTIVPSGGGSSLLIGTPPGLDGC
jgi:RHS repeat-associated protein